MRWAATLLAAVVLAGCAGIPTSGPVQRVADDRGRPQSTVRYAPVGPARGASPQQIVRGYLDAMLAYPVSTGTAAAYLTPEAADSWASADGVTVYTEPRVTLARSTLSDGEEQSAVVDLRTTTVERLDRQGHTIGTRPPNPRSYVLAKVRGQWRITNPQPGVMVTRSYYADYFRAFPIYFFDAPGQRLVPEVVHLAVGDQLPTGLVTSLVGGTSSGTLRTYLPRAAALESAVSVNDQGIADVKLSSSLARLDDDERNHLAAQVVWTLRAVPGLAGVRIFGDDAILRAGDDRIQSIGAWGEFGPLAVDSRTYATVGNRLVQVDGGTLKRVSGPWGSNALRAVDLAVAGNAIAAVLPGRGRVRITDRDGKNPRSHDGEGLIAPRWDQDGQLWLVDRPDGVTRVRLVPSGNKARAVATVGLGRLVVRSFDVSPDGARVALEAGRAGGASLYVCDVLRDRKNRVIGLGTPRRLDTGVPAPHSVSWATTTRLVFLGSTEAGVQVHEVGIDGTDVEGGAVGGGPLLPDVDAAHLVADAGTDGSAWVTDARRRLWYLAPGRSWRLLDDRAFRGLSSGD
jgi:hypothetical protein